MAAKTAAEIMAEIVAGKAAVPSPAVPSPAASGPSAPLAAAQPEAEPAPVAPPHAPESGSGGPRRFRVKLRDCAAAVFEAPDAHDAERQYRKWAGIISTIHPFDIELVPDPE